jgi:hypothetical protein
MRSQRCTSSSPDPTSPRAPRSRATGCGLSGPERIAREASWTSQVLPFDAPVTEIESVTWDEHVPEGTTLTVEVGSCHKADCSDIMWATASSNAMSIATASYLQLRVKMTSDGVAEPELRQLHLRAR